MDMRQIKEQLAALTGSGYVGDAGTGFPTAAPAGISSTERGAYTPMLPSNPARALPPGSTAARSGYEEASFEFDQADGGPEAEDRMPTLEDAEKELISDALKRYDGNRRQAARALGISERTLYRKIKDFDIT
jgi:DNA-binding NtrC family response regulator